MTAEAGEPMIPYVGVRNAAGVGRSIRDARIRTGLTQRELAHAAQVTRELVSLVEQGHRLPRIETLVPILDALDLSLAFLPRPAWPPESEP